MSTTKIEVLEYMKEQVQQGYVVSKYILKGENKCEYCVVGHGLKRLGFTDEQLLLLDIELGSASIAIIMDADDDAERKQFLEQSKVSVSNLIREKLHSVQFTKEELQSLQLANDVEGKEELLKVLDKLIEDNRGSAA